MQFEMMINRNPYIVDRESLAAIIAGDLQFAIRAFQILGDSKPNLAELYFTVLCDRILGRNGTEEEIIL